MGYREKEIERIISETINLIASDTYRNTDGGWGNTIGRPSNTWTTAEISELLAMLSESLGINVTKVHLPTILEVANNFLADHQNQDGGWGFDNGKSDATGTELVLITLAQSGQRKFHSHLQRALEWMAQNQNPEDAGWGLKGRESISSLYCTCFGCIALSKLSEELKTPIVEQRLLGLAITSLQKARNTDGGWGKIQSAPSTALETAYAVFTLTAMFNLHQLVESGIAWLKQHQNQDGGWGEVKGGTVESTAAAITALLAFGIKPNSTCISRGIDYLLNCHDVVKGGWSNNRNQDPTIWATYYALKALSVYLITSREGFDNKLSVWERTKIFLLSPKANIILVPLLILAILILCLQYFNILRVIVGTYSDLMNTLATIVTLLSFLWGLTIYLLHRSRGR